MQDLATLIITDNGRPLWHCRYLFDVLMVLITHPFLARLANWSHPCNRRRQISLWQQLWAVPTLPSLKRVGTVGEFSSFLCFWSLMYFLHGLPSGPIQETVDSYYLSGSDFRHCQRYRPLYELVPQVIFHHSCASDHSRISCIPCQVVPSLQPWTATISLAVIAPTANATVPYKSWHHRWIFIILVLLITHAFLARLAKWSHPGNRGQLLSFWQWFPPLPTLPSLIITGTTGEFSSFF